MIKDSKDWRISVKDCKNCYIGDGLVVECYYIGGGVFGGSLGYMMYSSKDVKRCVANYKAEKGIKGKHIKVIKI